MVVESELIVYGRVFFETVAADISTPGFLLGIAKFCALFLAMKASAEVHPCHFSFFDDIL